MHNLDIYNILNSLIKNYHHSYIIIINIFNLKIFNIFNN